MKTPTLDVESATLIYVTAVTLRYKPYMSNGEQQLCFLLYSVLIICDPCFYVGVMGFHVARQQALEAVHRPLLR